LLQNIPVNSVKEFEHDYLNVLDIRHKDVLDKLRGGVIDDSVTDVLKTVAKEVAGRFVK